MAYLIARAMLKDKNRRHLLSDLAPHFFGFHRISSITSTSTAEVGLITRQDTGCAVSTSTRPVGSSTNAVLLICTKHVCS